MSLGSVKIETKLGCYYLKVKPSYLFMLVNFPFNLSVKDGNNARIDWEASSYRAILYWSVDLNYPLCIATICCAQDCMSYARARQARPPHS